MPGMITHYICAESTLAILPDDAKGILTANRQMYNIGSQGPDVFFYYYPSVLFSGRRGIGSIMHVQKTGEYIAAMAKGLRGLNGKAREAAFAYAAGYLTHYCLDCAAHPYVYYKTGFKRPGEKGSTLKYSAYHRSFETAIDVLMLKLMSGKRPADEKLWRLIRSKRKAAMDVADFLGGCISDVYGANIKGRHVYYAMRWMWRTTLLLQSAKGRRKRFMEIAEDIIIGNRVCSAMVHPQKVDGLDYLNNKKTPWKLPWDDGAENHSSFTELFDEACNQAGELVAALHECAFADGDLEEFLAMAGNRSLKSGLDNSREAEFKYHDIIYR